MEKNIRIVIHDEISVIGKLIDNEIYIPYSAMEKVYETYGRWIRQEQIFKINTTKLTVGEIEDYDFKGHFLNSDKIRVENWRVEFDEAGIPKTIYKWGSQYNPSTIAQYGFQLYSLYFLQGNDDEKRKCLNVAKWFIENQNSNGGWAYHFDHDYFHGRVEMVKAPWYSAISQGMALSFLTRVYHLTLDDRYCQSALNSLNIFKTPVNEGGILATFENKYHFYEESPTNPSSFILNGFMFALLGLYDLYKTTNSAEALKLYTNGIATLKRMLPLYDMGNRTAYDLTHYTTDGGFPNVAKWGYHIVHVQLLMVINLIEKDKKIDEAIKRWMRYLKGKNAYLQK